jgi:hypothetical protein
LERWQSYDVTWLDGCDIGLLIDVDDETGFVVAFDDLDRLEPDCSVSGAPVAFVVADLDGGCEVARPETRASVSRTTRRKLPNPQRTNLGT